MNILFNGVDIHNDVQTIEASYTDNSGGKADLLELTFADPSGYLWAQWNAMDDVQMIEIKTDDITTGKMFIHNVIDAGNGIEIIAASLSKSAKTKRSSTWIDVKFDEVANSLSMRNGLTYSPFTNTRLSYAVLNQVDLADVAFFNRLCTFEGFRLKIHDGKLVVYKKDETAPNITITRDDKDGPVEFSQEKRIGKATVISGRTHFSYGDGDGLEHIERCHLNSIGEAERWARNLYFALNESTRSAKFSVRLNTKIAAGTNVLLDGFPGYDGVYFVERATHEFVNIRTNLLLYKTEA